MSLTIFRTWASRSFPLSSYHNAYTQPRSRRVWCSIAIHNGSNVGYSALLEFRCGIEITLRHFRIDLKDFFLDRVQKPLHWLNVFGRTENEPDVG